MRHFIGTGHRSVQHIVNALNQTVSLPWESSPPYGRFSCDFPMFIGMVSGFLNASVELEMVQDKDLNAILKYIFDSEEELSVCHSREAIVSLSEQGICFFRSAEVYFQHCFLEYPPDKRVWFTDTALGLATLIAQQLFPVEVVENVR